MSLNPDQLYVLGILKQSLLRSNEQVSASEIVVPKVADIIASSGILLTVYPDIGKESDSKSKELAELLRKKYYRVKGLSVLQENEESKILSALSENGFKTIALKGLDIKKLYPDEVQREMGDIDILILNYVYKKIETIMDHLGYRSKGKTNWMHDSFTNGDVTVELHKRLSDDSDITDNWEKRMVERAVSVGNDGCVMKMTIEDIYIHHIIHMYTDFISGSFGLRRIADTWLLMNSMNSSANDYAGEVLTLLDMQEFSNRMRKLAACCFGDISMDADDEALLKYAMSAGINGNGNSNKASRTIYYSTGNGKHGKARSVLNSVFPPINRMKAQFPILDPHIYLLPFCWFIRVFDHMRNISKYKRQIDYSGVSEQDYQIIRDVFAAGGIDAGSMKK